MTDLPIDDTEVDEPEFIDQNSLHLAVAVILGASALALDDEADDGVLSAVMLQWPDNVHGDALAIGREVIDALVGFGALDATLLYDLSVMAQPIEQPESETE